jgi:hypothetical protein
MSMRGRGSSGDGQTDRRRRGGVPLQRLGAGFLRKTGTLVAEVTLTLFSGHLERENVHYGKQTPGVHS